MSVTLKLSLVRASWPVSLVLSTISPSMTESASTSLSTWGEKRSSQAPVVETHLLQEPPVLLPDQGPAGGHEVLQLGHLGLVLLPHHCQDAVSLLLLFCQGSLQVAASVHLEQNSKCISRNHI